MIAQILLILMSSASILAATWILFGDRLPKLRRRRPMAVVVRRRPRMPQRPEVLCDADVSGWKPQGGGR